MIYDTTRNITWLANMNTNGGMQWGEAVAWADNLVHGGFSNWRLPTLIPADASCTGAFGMGCTGGELSGLFVTELGNKPYESVLNPVGDTVEQIANLALFSNVQVSYYWSGQDSGGSEAWNFWTGYGQQEDDAKNYLAYAVAVRPGDVTASVPEPQTLALALLALGATVVARRRRPA